MKQKKQVRDRIVFPNEVSEVVGVSDRTLRRWEKEGRFPRRFNLAGPGSRCGWKESTIDEWMQCKGV